MKIKGKAHVFDRDDIDTDMIIPAKYLNTDDHGELATALLYDLFRETGLVVVDGRWPDLRRAAAPLFRRYVERRAEAERAVGAAGEALVSAGYRTPIAAASSSTVTLHRKAQPSLALLTPPRSPRHAKRAMLAPAARHSPCRHPQAGSPTCTAWRHASELRACRECVRNARRRDRSTVSVSRVSKGLRDGPAIEPRFAQPGEAGLWPAAAPDATGWRRCLRRRSAPR